MCRLALKSANEPFSPYEVLTAMEAMQEGYDGSGLGLLLRGLEFEDFKYNPNFPVLSGIAHTEKAWNTIKDYMEERGYELKYDHRFHHEEGHIEATDRFRYFMRAYRMPPAFRDKSTEEREEELLKTRLALRALSNDDNKITVFSFYPDVAMIKEVGWPLQIGNGLCLHDGQIKSRICMAQGRQNTNYGINLYACHPFFIQGISTMTNGENTAFVPIRDWLIGKQIPGYMGYQSDSEVFTHILHYTLKKLKLPLQAYKHIITPLNSGELKNHPQGEFLSGLRQACKRLIIDGPNAVIGTLPDETSLLVMDQKKLRPATVGGREGAWAIASELCGVDALVPDRDPSSDFQPMREHTVIIPPHRKELEIWSQYDPFPSIQAA
ncbi:class II glutamine amidotransferase domain-containing protein [Desulforhopalus singaporensis]|uniref:Glutamate synthase (NADPH) GltB1 subunit n=1 Tax=Desulforhopalus singaporensis TaxID=91360 RepID=A0A1H0J884_9BACT|nr:glutamate synthase [Desulforhopalus singaporensis]SDO39947.1 glutamate synthase (NADPH) GltB1 subunit [Desulforhopalus singaporensis]